MDLGTDDQTQGKGKIERMPLNWVRDPALSGLNGFLVRLCCPDLGPVYTPCFNSSLVSFVRVESTCRVCREEEG